MINPGEMLCVVDEDNNPLDPKPRDMVHGQGLWHRTSHIYIKNPENLILCQRRSVMKDQNPQMWESHFGGHVLAGGEYLDFAQIELEEELGIKADKKLLKSFGIYKSEKDKEFQAVYGLLWSGKTHDLKLEETEVEEVAWFTIDELRQIFEREDDDWVIHGNELEVLEWLENFN